MATKKWAWTDQKDIVARIKTSLLDTGVLDASYLDKDAILALKDIDIEDNIWFLLAKRALAEYQLEQDCSQTTNKKKNEPSNKGVASKGAIKEGNKETARAQD